MCYTIVTVKSREPVGALSEYPSKHDATINAESHRPYNVSFIINA